MKDETYYIYYGYRSSYIKSALDRPVAISELIDPILPWKKSYIEVTFSLNEKYTIHLPSLFSNDAKVTLNGNHFLTITGSPSTTYFCYSTNFEKLLLEFNEIQTGEKYELLLNQNPVGHILYWPFLNKELLNKKIGTEVFVPVTIGKIAILFALWRKDYTGPMT